MAEENSPNPELAPENPEFEEYQENSISSEPDKRPGIANDVVQVKNET